MIVVTGGAGFIGSNIVKGLNALGRKDIVVVDDLTDGTKFANLVDLDISNYLDKDDFLERIKQEDKLNIEAIFHQGAISATTEWNGKLVMDNNYNYSKELLNYCLQRQIPFLYASSAATYGSRTNNFIEDRQFEKPLNVYGYSKFLFDEHVRKILPKANSPICGFKYFNVYGPREHHKGSMASVAFHLAHQIKNGEPLQLFENSNNFKRDFIYVDDVVAVNLWFWHNKKSGIYNCGTGKAESFQDVADAVIAYHQQGEISYIPFPPHLQGRYQTFTEADLTRLKTAGCALEFKTVEQGVFEYMKHLHAEQ